MRSPPNALLAAGLLTLTLSLAPPVIAPAPARACGVLIASETSQNLAIAAQRALMIVGPDTIALHLQLAAATDGKAFSWVIPVPAGSGAPTVALGDQAIFDALDALTTPSVTISHGGGGGGGGFCGDAKAGGDFGDTRGGVQHFGGASLGDYTYDVIAGSKPEQVAAWLTDHGYVVPEAFADAITPYTAKNVFVAVRLAAGSSATSASGGATNRPIVVTWTRAFEADLGYAFGLSKLSAADTTPLLLWVLADKRQRIANYGSTDVAHVAAAMRDGDLAYDEAIASLTTAAGGRLATTEFAKDLRGLDVPTALAALVDDDSFYLTRLYAEVPRAAIEDLVITFAANAPDVEPDVTIASARYGGTPLVMASSLVVLLLLRRRRR